MASSFLTAPENFHYNRKLGLSDAELQSKKTRLRDQLAKNLDKSYQQKKTVILSGENVWVMSQDELKSIQSFLRAHGYEPEVYIYLRSWKSWIESDFQEGIKQGTRLDEFFPKNRHKHLDYSGQIEILQNVFGSEKTKATPFEASRFPAGCVVQDFCERAEIPLHPSKTIRVNEGLSVDAIKLLYAFRLFHNGYQTGIRSIIHNEILFRRLSSIPGKRIRFSNCLIEPYKHLWIDQIPQMQRLLDESFGDSTAEKNTKDCISDFSQLTDYSQESLDWLSRATGKKRICRAKGESTTQAVGEQMNQLCYNPSIKSRLMWHYMIAKRRAVHFKYGC